MCTFLRHNETGLAPSSAPHTPRQQAGFTLLELLVATVLLSIVMSSVYTLFNTTIGTWRGVEERFTPYPDARNSMALIQREYENFVWPAAHLMEGGRNEVTLYVVSEPMDVSDTEGRHMMRVRYYLANRRLMREEALVEVALPVRPPDGRDLARDRIKVGRRNSFVLADNVRDFQVGYVWVPTPDERDMDYPPDWMEEIMVHGHRERWGLPQGLQIALTLYDPEGQAPDQTFLTRISTRGESNRLRYSELTQMIGAS